MWELDHKEGWVPKSWFFQIVVLEKTLERPLHHKEIKSVNPKGNQRWIFSGSADTEGEAPILWSPDTKSRLIGKTLMLGKIEGKRRMGWQMMRWLDSMNLSKLWEMLKDREAWRAAPRGHQQLDMTDWTTTATSEPGVLTRHPEKFIVCSSITEKSYIKNHSQPSKYIIPR